MLPQENMACGGYFLIETANQLAQCIAMQLTHWNF